LAAAVPARRSSRSAAAKACQQFQKAFEEKEDTEPSWEYIAFPEMGLGGTAVVGASKKKKEEKKKKDSEESEEEEEAEADGDKGEEVGASMSKDEEGARKRPKKDDKMDEQEDEKEEAKDDEEGNVDEKEGNVEGEDWEV